MNKLLNIGIIGLGIGRKHLEAFHNNKNCNVKIISDFFEENLQNIKREFPNIHCAKNASEILFSPTVDVVSIASYDNFHFEQVTSAIKNNKHVFVEKPLCQFQEELVEIEKLYKNSNGIKLSSNMVLRANPRFKRIKDEINSGAMGEIFYVEADYLWGRIEKLTKGWRTEMDFYSIIAGAAIHMIDLIIWMIGEWPITVYALGNNLATKEGNLRFDSFAAMLFKFPSGLIAKVTANGGCVHPHFHSLKIFGSKKTAIHNISDGIWLNDQNKGIKHEKILEEYPAKHTREEIIHNFVDSILDNEKEAAVSSTDVFRIMKVCFAAQCAAKEFLPQEINYN